MRARGVLRTVVLPVACATAVALCITMLFLSMRAVLEVGGACASGGPYEIATPCPRGVGWMFPVGMIGGMISALGLALTAGRGPRLWLLAWPALFLSLGWNFLEFGLHPPGEGGVSPGFLVCAAVFAPMGAVPLAVVLRAAPGKLFWGDPLEDPGERPGRLVLIALLVAAVAVGVWLGVRVVDVAG